MAAHPLLSDVEWLRPRWERGDTVSDIAAEAAANEATVYLWLARHALPKRAHEIDRRDVERRLAKGQSVPEIAAAYDVDRAVIYDRLYRWGLRTPGVAVERDPEQLRQWYQVQEWSTQRIAEELGISRRSAVRLLLAAGITLRPPGRRRSSTA